MGSRDRDAKSLQDKLKVFFKKGGNVPLPPLNELVITSELLREMGPEAPLHRRLRALKDIGDKAYHVRIYEYGVEKLWSCTRDLLVDSNVEARHTALWFMQCLTTGQAEYLSIMRTIFFKYLRETPPSNTPEDYPLRFKLLHSLTNSGKNITCFEELMGVLLLEWMLELSGQSLVELLQLTINVVKFNAAYLDKEVVDGLVKMACHVCLYGGGEAVGAGGAGDAVATCLSLCEAVISYSLLPRATLPVLVDALCRTVNHDYHAAASWKLMLCLVGTDLGPMAVAEMCTVAEGGGGAARGAVFCLGAALWGARPPPALWRPSPQAVLPALFKAAKARQEVVTYEVAVAASRLVARFPHELLPPAWDVLLDVTRELYDHYKSVDPPNEVIGAKINALLSSIEQLHTGGQFCGDSDQLLDLLDHTAHDRPESTTMRLVTQLFSSLSPASRGWVSRAATLADKYVRRDPRLAVRLHALDAMLQLVCRHIGAYEEELLEGVCLGVLGACAGDAEVAMRAAAARGAQRLALRAQQPQDLVDLLEKILNRPFSMYVTDVPIPAEAEVEDLQAAVAGLVAAFHALLPAAAPAPAARCLLVLLDHLDHHYRRPAIFHHHPSLRMQIFELLFGLRANQFNCIGHGYDAEGAGRPVWGEANDVVRVCAPLLLVEPLASRGAPHTKHTVPPGAIVLPSGRMSACMTAALTKETDWGVARGVLAALPVVLRARTAVGRRAPHLDLLATHVAQLLMGERTEWAGRVAVSELTALVVGAVAALAPLLASLEPHTQTRLVRATLRHGMALRSPAPFLALTLLTLEARDTMVKMLPEVLLDLSKVSDTKLIAAPMLEFLSMLSRLPRVFASFVEDQYMSVFAIVLPYTNPSRYNHYVVSLAHHVIAAWFLKCRLSYRRNFVQFIIHGLHNYIIMPFEEQLQYRAGLSPAAANEDSSNRKRSSSLGSKNARGGGALSGGGGAGGGASAALHVELTETCVDLLARYTFTPCSVKPLRSDIAEFMFAGGQSTTWLVGHKLITITTSGCQQNSMKQGLCDKCAALCRAHVESGASQDSAAQTSSGETRSENGGSASGSTNQLSSQPHLEVKRYSKTSLQHSRSVESSSCSSLSADVSLALPTSGLTSRQNSSENNGRSGDPIADALHEFSQKIESLSKEVEASQNWTWRAGEVSGRGGCPCWCGSWAGVHLRTPTGDLAWLMRIHNQMNWDHTMESPLQEVLAVLTPSTTASASVSASASASTSGLGTTEPSTVSEGGGGASGAGDEARSRSGSASSHSFASTHHNHNTHHNYSSTDSLSSASERRHSAAEPAPQRRTAPINIPASVSRGANDDMLLVVPEGKSRHPVRRSNSSPEMSSSWQLDEPPRVSDLIVLPSCEPATASQSMHAVKKATKKTDMRVSCEAIPEEMCGTSPLPASALPPPVASVVPSAIVPAAVAGEGRHPHLVTYRSDPGDSRQSGNGVSETGEEALQADSRHQLQKAVSDSKVQEGRSSSSGGVSGGAGGGRNTNEELPPLSRSRRSNTISVMNRSRQHASNVNDSRSSIGGNGGGSGIGGGSSGGGGGGGGVTPSFLILQLYHNMSTYPVTPRVPGEAVTATSPLAERPLKVSGAQHERTIKNLDLVPPLDTYKIGVLYVGPGQEEDEVAIMRNEYGSLRYMEFLQGLGSLVPLTEGSSEQPDMFLNLERGGKDGHYTYVWSDDMLQVQFHVATAMPTTAKDPSCVEKRKYIGNDYVSIVYNDSGKDFNIHTIKGQFNLCIVVVCPLEGGVSRVSLRCKDERARALLPPPQPALLSDHHAPALARQVALHAAMACQICVCGGGGEAWAGNCLERLRHIKRLRRRALADRLAAARRPPYAPPASASRAHIDDFNDYT